MNVVTSGLICLKTITNQYEKNMDCRFSPDFTFCL